MIINIRGTSGSGKTTLVRHFFSLCDTIIPIIPEGSKKIQAYKCSYNGQTVVVLGTYENACGGCDTISSQDEICQLIEEYHLEGHVIFESLFVSHIYGRYAQMASRDPNNFLFLMLGTPYEQCIQHIKERREAAGNFDELKESVYNNAKRTYDSTYRIRDKLTRDNLRWMELPMNNRFANFEEILEDELLW